MLRKVSLEKRRGHCVKTAAAGVGGTFEAVFKIFGYSVENLLSSEIPELTLSLLTQYSGSEDSAYMRAPWYLLKFALPTSSSFLRSQGLTKLD